MSFGFTFTIKETDCGYLLLETNFNLFKERLFSKNGLQK